MQGGNRARPQSSPPWALLAIVPALVFVAYVRLHYADIPLERDEGEYAYAGQLILKGIPPYELAYNMKFPGTYYAYALILAIFGQTPWGIHIGLWLVNAATMLLVFAIGRRLLGDLPAAVAATSFAFLSVDRWILGVFAHATNFVALAAMVGLLLLLRAIESERRSTFFWSGVFLGLSVLMKQHAIFYLPFAAAYVYWSERRKDGQVFPAAAKKIGVMAVGAVLPLALVVAVLSAQGVVGRFWFWTFQYAREYVSEIRFAKALPNLVTGFRVVTTANAELWILGALGLFALWIARWEPKARVLVTGLLAASFLAICPGFYFRGHYYILLLPAVALLGGVAVDSLRRILETRVSPRLAAALAVAVVLAAVGSYVFRDREYFFEMDSRDLSRTLYGHNPFIEAVEIGKYIRERTDKNDRIAVLGSEPEIYFYADRLAATGYIYTYALMEPQPYAATMQKEMIKEIESAHARYLVFSWIDYSWMAQKESDQSIIAWANAYVGQCYDPVGVADIFSKDKSFVAWGDEALTYEPVTPDVVYTFRRKSDSPCTASQ